MSTMVGILFSNVDKILLLLDHQLKYTEEEDFSIILKMFREEKGSEMEGERVF